MTRHGLRYVLDRGSIGLCALMLGALVLMHLPQSAAADNTDNWQRLHALAMHGMPKYGVDSAQPDKTCFDYARADAPQGGTLRQVSRKPFDNLNPSLLFGTAPDGLHLVHAPLMQRGWDEPFTMYPMVARAVEIPPETEGGRRHAIRFLLDPSAQFHDGTPITATDVKASFEAIRAHGRPNARAVYKLVDNITTEAPDQITFWFTDAADREVALILAMMPVYSAEDMRLRANQGQPFEKTTLSPLLGSGPYRVGDFESGRFIAYDRVRPHWADTKLVQCGHHHFDTVRWDIYRDQSVARTAFEAGQFDVQREVNLNAWQQKYDFVDQADAKARRVVIKHGRPVPARMIVMNTRRPPLDQVAMRQGLASLFNAKWLNDTLYQGGLERLTSVYHNSALASPDGFTPLDSMDTRDNMTQALAFFQQAGWQLVDGKLQNETEETLSLELILTRSAEEKIALHYRKWLRRLGIDLTIRTVDSAQYTRRLQDFAYDLVIAEWRSSLSPGTEQAQYWGSAAADQLGSFNYAGVKDAIVDGAITRLTTAVNYDDLVTAAHKIDQRIMAGVYGIPLFAQTSDHLLLADRIKTPDRHALYGAITETWWQSQNE